MWPNNKELLIISVYSRTVARNSWTCLSVAEEKAMDSYTIKKDWY